MSLAQVKDPTRRHALGCLGVSLFMLALAALDALTRGNIQLPALIPPFGASVVIVFFAPESPAARSWNVILGQLVSAFSASSVLALSPNAPVGLQAALAVSGAGLLMLGTRSFHPPGGASALFAVVAEQKLGFGMLLCPILLGALLLMGIRYALDQAVAQRPKRLKLPATVPRREARYLVLN